MELTKSELEVMNVIWRENRALSRNEIINMSEDKSWKASSIHILLNGLLSKGAIKEDGFVRSGKVWGRLYAPAISYEKYYIESVFSLHSFKNLLPMLVTALVDSDEMTVDVIDELEDRLRARRDEICSAQQAAECPPET